MINWARRRCYRPSASRACQDPHPPRNANRVWRALPLQPWRWSGLRAAPTPGAGRAWPGSLRRPGGSETETPLCDVPLCLPWFVHDLHAQKRFALVHGLCGRVVSFLLGRPRAMQLTQGGLNSGTGFLCVWGVGGWGWGAITCSGSPGEWGKSSKDMGSAARARAATLSSPSRHAIKYQ